MRGFRYSWCCLRAVGREACEVHRLSGRHLQITQSLRIGICLYGHRFQDCLERVGSRPNFLRRHMSTRLKSSVAQHGLSKQREDSRTAEKKLHGICIVQLTPHRSSTPSSSSLSPTCIPSSTPPFCKDNILTMPFLFLFQVPKDSNRFSPEETDCLHSRNRIVSKF